MGKKVTGTSPVRQAFLEEASQYGDDVLTEAIGSVLWCELAKNAVYGGKTLLVPGDVVLEGRKRSRDPILSYVQTHDPIEMRHVEGCARDCGSLAAEYTCTDPQYGDPNATELSVEAYGDAWDAISDKIKGIITAGFAC
ncbi:MAG TPA: hypothetical protein VMR50_10530 [Myxococcota bacterium]|nr:hypothetical protein [Myxococcota bacterium]